MKYPDAIACAARILCVMVVLPVGFLAVYPLAYLMLPEFLARRADLPRDLSMVLLCDVAAAPLVALGLYVRARAARRRRDRGGP